MLGHLVLIGWMTIANSGSVMRSSRSVGDDEGGGGVFGVGPVPHLLLLLNVAREEQARHTAGYQTTPVWFLWQLTHGLLSSPVFAQKGRRRRRQPRRGQSQCEL